jgi:hypothetical protein
MRFALGAAPPAFLLVLLEEPSLQALRSVVGPQRRIGLGDEHVAIRQHVQPRG